MGVGEGTETSREEGGGLAADTHKRFTEKERGARQSTSDRSQAPLQKYHKQEKLAGKLMESCVAKNSSGTSLARLTFVKSLVPYRDWALYLPTILRMAKSVTRIKQTKTPTHREGFKFLPAVFYSILDTLSTKHFCVFYCNTFDSF